MLILESLIMIMLLFLNLPVLILGICLIILGLGVRRHSLSVLIQLRPLTFAFDSLLR